MNKYICIKESKGFTLGMTYYGRISSVKIKNIDCYFFEGIHNDFSWKVVCSTSNVMLHSEWLALEREKQIKSVLDE